MARKKPSADALLGIYSELAEVNDQARTADGFEEAYLGILTRFGMDPIACYDRSKCIQILMKRDGMSREDAEEYFDFNVIGSWVGEGTPAFLEPVSR